MCPAALQRGLEYAAVAATSLRTLATKLPYAVLVALFIPATFVVPVVWLRFFRAASPAEYPTPSFQRAIRYYVEETQDDPYPDEDVDDGEELARRCRGREIPVADGGERHDAEVERVEQAPPLNQRVKQAPEASVTTTRKKRA